MSTIKEFYDKVGTIIPSCLRLTVKVDSKSNKKLLYFYDRGTRVFEDPLGLLSTNDYRGEPRFLEDIINAYPDAEVSIHEYGKYASHRTTVDSIIDARIA